ncbi:MAG: response regulator [Gammaproteobacteria bacterium]
MANILVVDDDRLIRMQLTDVLEEADHQVVEADDGSKVAALLRQGLPHILITDLIMPGQEGIETILQLKKSYPTLPIIAISGNSEYLGMAEILGVDIIMTKPIDEQRLLENVDKLLVSL